MPLREQSRIKADTVAEECTCSVCHERGCPSPAPEPSAPPTGVPVCATGVHVPTGRRKRCHCGTTVCDCDGCNAMVSLNPPPSAPVTVATGEPVSAHPAPFAHDCDIVPDDEIPTAEEGAETCKRLGIDVPAWAADVRARVAAVATGGVPSGYRLGDGWEVVGGITDWGCSQEIDSDHCNATPAFVGPAEDSSHPAWQAGACAAHAVEMGALVPIDTARSVPPGPVPVEACADEDVCKLGLCPACNPPAAPASEPAVRPLSERMQREVAPSNIVAIRAGIVTDWAQEVAVLEAELAETKASGATWVEKTMAARAEVEQLNSTYRSFIRAVKESSGWTPAPVAVPDVEMIPVYLANMRTEVEQLRGKLAEERAGGMRGAGA